MPDTNPPTVVIKIGGSTLAADDTSLADVVALSQEARRPVLVHGGGPEITSWMKKLGLRAEFVRGLRVTDAPGLDVASAVLAGLINKRLVAGLLAEGGRAVGLSGADGGMLRGRVTDASLGLVAGSVEVDVGPLEALMGPGYIPVVAPLAVDESEGHRLLNVNADTVAGALAAALGATHLVFLTDVDGVLDDGRLLGHLPVARAEALISSGIVKGGMIPKVQACIDARMAGVEPHIINATVPHALVACVNGASPGTTVV